MRKVAILTVTLLFIAVLGLMTVMAYAPAPDYTSSVGQVGDQALFIRSYRVDVTVEDQIARTSIEQVFVNNGSTPAEGTYIFPLPPGVTISDLVMRIDGEAYSARILEKEEAAQVYSDIVRTLRDPALLQYIGTNAIQANVFPIPGGGERTLEIEYSQVLALENNLFHYVYPLRTEHLSTLPVGQLNIRVEVETDDPVSNIYSSSHNPAINRLSDRNFVASFETTNTLEANDFHLYYGVQNDEVSVNVLTFRESAAEDGFFLAMVAPPVIVDAQNIIPKDVVIVLDSSGSMQGEKWEQAKEAAKFVLDNLNSEDRFNIVLFSSSVRTYATSPQGLDEVNDAKAWLDVSYDAGGTNIDWALQTALDLNDQEHQQVILFLTDGLATEGEVEMDNILENVEARSADNVRIFTFGVGDDVNTFLLDELSLRHNGASEYVRPFERIDEKVSALYSKVSSPVLTDLVMEFDGVDVYDLHPQRLPDLFAGSQLLVAGRYRGEGDDVTLTLSGDIDGESVTFVYDDLEFRVNAGGDELIPRLWATRRIGHLLNQIRLGGENDELVESIVQLSLRYGIITPYTSFIITEDDILGQENQTRIIDQINPTATALALMPSGQNAVDAAQASGGLSNQGVAPTMPAMFPTASAAPTLHFTLDSTNTSILIVTPVPGTGTPLPSSTPTTTPLVNMVTATPLPGGGAIKAVGDRTFILREGVWIDTTYDPEEMEPIEIEFLSEEYFELLAEDERVAEFYALGEQVIFVLDDVAYQIIL